MGCELIVIRHGETAWNAEGRIQGHRPIGLNERGRRQAAALATRMTQEDFSTLYSSDLLRARETADSISKLTGHAVQTDTGLREWDLGVLAGLTPSEAEQKQSVCFLSYRDRLPDGPVEGGETVRERYRRVIDAVTGIISLHSGETVALVTHGGPLDDLRRFAEQIPIGGKPPFELYNAGLHRFRVTDDRWEILAWGDVAHLDAIGSLSDW